MAQQPWVMELRDERCLPAWVLGPVDFLAFLRLALRRTGETAADAIVGRPPFRKKLENGAGRWFAGENRKFMKRAEN
jgi:hypothetical protein